MGASTVSPSVRGLQLPAVDAIEQIAFLVAFVLVVLFAIAFQFLEVRALYGSDDPAPDEQRTNCPSCGARVGVGADTCEYCGERVDR